MAQVVIIKREVWDKFHSWMYQGGVTAEGLHLVTPALFDLFRNNLQSSLSGTKFLDIPEEALEPTISFDVVPPTDPAGAATPVAEAPRNPRKPLTAKAPATPEAAQQLADLPE